MHRNPVKRGPVLAPQQWAWSSFRHYAYGEAGPVLVNEAQKAEMRGKNRLTSAAAIPTLRTHEAWGSRFHGNPDRAARLGQPPTDEIKSLTVKAEGSPKFERAFACAR